MKTKINIAIFCCILMTIESCKKVEVTDGKVEKTNFYKHFGYSYLFTIDNVLFDSVRPLYFGKTSKGDVKFIVSEYKNGTKSNTAFIYNGKIMSWSLPGLSLSNLNWLDYYSLDMNNQLQYETNNSTSKYFYYLERDGVKPSNKWTTKIGDSFMMKYASYSWTWKPKDLYSMKYYYDTITINEPYIYKGGLFDYYGASFLIYHLPKDIHAQNFGSDLHLVKRSKSGVDYSNSFYSDKLVVDMDGGSEIYQEGLNVDLVETGTPNPMFMFWSGRNSFTQKNVVFIPSYNSTELVNVNFPYSVYNSLKIFFHHGNIYANSINQLFKANTQNSNSEPVDLQLLNIKGVFGNSNAIIVVIENKDRGLDVVELN